MTLPATTIISPDEKAWVLEELNLQGPDGRGFHRYQLITVARGDKLAQHTTDMGLASNYRADQFRIPSLMEHTVGELWDMANTMRETAPLKDRVEPTDLVGEYFKLSEWLQSARKRLSVKRRKLIHGTSNQEAAPTQAH